MADATLAEMRNRVLEKLFVLIAGEVASSEDQTTIETVIENTNEQLREQELCYWENSATPRYLMEHLAAYYACFCANDYMDAREAAIFVQTNELKALMKIRELLANRPRVDEPSRAVYF